MIRKSIRYPLVYFVVYTVWQLITDKKVNWLDNMGVCFIMFLLMLFYNWTKIPYEWEKDKK